MTARIYKGALRRGYVATPTRLVGFAAGEPVEFDDDELEHLDPAEWVDPKPPKRGTDKATAANKKEADDGR